MMTEENSEKVYYTYGMIKPDGMPNMMEIIKMILGAGLQIQYVEFDILSDKIIEENYPHCVGKDFYPGMKENLQSGMVLKMLIFDPKGNAVNNYRKVLGATKSWEADADTIRGTFGDKKITYKNAAHGSGNVKEAGEEIIRFFGVNILLLLEDLRKDSATRTFYGVNNKYGDLNDYEYTMDNINDAMMKYMNK